MRKTIMLTVASLGLAATLAGGQPKKDIGYDPVADAFEQLDSTVARAEAADKLVLLISGGDWCIWCHYLAAFLEREPVLDAALHDVFIVQKVYVGDENMNKTFFDRLPKAAGAPHFWVLSARGEVLGSQDTLPLEDGDKSYDRDKFLAFVERWREHSGAN
jgi:hypothetical protein